MAARPFKRIWKADLEPKVLLTLKYEIVALERDGKIDYSSLGVRVPPEFVRLRHFMA